VISSGTGQPQDQVVKKRYKSGAQNPTYVFFHDFVEARHERTPLEELDGFFDSARLGRGEFHENVE